MALGRLERGFSVGSGRCGALGGVGQRRKGRHMKSIQIRQTTAAAALDDYVLPYRGWIEQTLGCAYSGTVTLETSNALADVAAQQLVAGVRVYESAHAGWLDVCKDWAVPPGASPRICVSRYREQVSGSEPVSAWAVSWDECPIAVRLKGLTTPIVALRVPAGFPGDRFAPNPKNWLIVRREDVCAVLKVLEFAAATSNKKYLHGASEIIPLTGRYDWDSLVLDATLTRLVRRDYETFFEREKWFRQHRLPFRRGYLLYGPPGNGKTSVIRVMAAHPQIEAYCVDLQSGDVADNELRQLFEAAYRAVPALIVLEDLDRVYTRNGASNGRTNVSFQALLNCLDGLGSRDGVVVVATANDPTALDPAILKRPGRFDRVVGFRTPSAALRRQYWLKLNTGLVGSAFDTAIRASEDFSFAQLRESYILAAQIAYDEGRGVNDKDLLAAVGIQQSGEVQRPTAGFRGNKACAGEKHEPRTPALNK